MSRRMKLWNWNNRTPNKIMERKNEIIETNERKLSKNLTERTNENTEWWEINNGTNGTTEHRTNSYLAVWTAPSALAASARKPTPFSAMFLSISLLRASKTLFTWLVFKREMGSVEGEDGGGRGVDCNNTTNTNPTNVQSKHRLHHNQHRHYRHHQKQQGSPT